MTLKSLVLFILLAAASVAQTTLHHASVARKKASGGGGTSPGTTNLVAWWDFNDTAGNGEVDSHSTYDLTEQSTPTYQSASSPEYGIAASPSTRWTQNSIDNNWGNVAGDYWYVIRFRGYSTLANNDWMFASNNNRYGVRWAPIAGEIRALAANLQVNIPVSPSTGNWYVVVCQIDDSAGEAKAWLNNANETTTTGTDTYGTVNATFGGQGTTGVNVEIDYVGFFTGLPTADNIAWLYNSGNTRVYGDL